MLNIQKLSKVFGDFSAVKDLDLILESGSIYALLGPNGAGKTTTIKMIMGLLKPTSGSVRICGTDISENRVEALKHVGYLPDEPFYHDYLKGSEILRFVGEVHGLSLKEIELIMSEYVPLFELEEAIEDYAVNFSLGMKKRLGLIASIIHSPEVLILDEPINGLDPYGVKILHEFLVNYVSKGKTVIYSTHVLLQAEQLCDSVGIIYKGELIRNAKLDDLKKEYSDSQSLEEIFFEITGHHVE
ncbi:MAG: ABC transporter ATP-binding protein [Planctomycetota bacterium]|nr:MAG: ABC transporter ATP-binding protein [Planctomycetota bacterium]